MTSSAALSDRGIRVCRGCGSASLVSVLDLGVQPLSNEMALSTNEVSQRFPLHLRQCTACSLGQVGEYVLPDRIFGDQYPYLSSTSLSWVEHARVYATRFTCDLDLDSTALVIEIASNDGYLLSQFRQLGSQVLGVEPASNVAALARAAGVPTINEFFGEECARRLVGNHGHPRLVAANNVMAHVPDLHDFIAGLAVLCDEDTLITVENPSLLTLLQEAQFDTIYHEHFSYLTAHAVKHAAMYHGLELVRVERLATHGGSNRYFLRLEGTQGPDETVGEILSEEQRGGLFGASLRESFADESHTIIHAVRNWLEQKHADRAQLAGYGAAAKGNTLLNAVGEEARFLSFVVDASAEKQGKFLPGPLVPVLPPEHLSAVPVDDVIIFPWNLASELTPIVHSFAPDANIWIPRPRMHRVS